MKRVCAVDDMAVPWVFGRRDPGIRSEACGRGRALKEAGASCAEDKTGVRVVEADFVRDRRSLAKPRACARMTYICQLWNAQAVVKC